ncbi:hypothetical protein [Streptomyces sp. MP131-18]|uniref:hypothetical protein n=1 Tax=Streptomyces sp. MP131-18 TaxID=1857892 RepID=UPI00097BB41A|nr:hypothetical protein [Streptomyces sp. MP131-18]ONK10386.1 hypothetical protein STBA_11080 [Streptomyces sp. MP131-18]
MSHLGDGFHDGAARPQESLQGEPLDDIMLMPLESVSHDNPRTAAADNIGKSWTSFLEPVPAAAPANSNPVH